MESTDRRCLLFSQDPGAQEILVVSLFCSKVPFSTSATCVLTGCKSTSIPIGSSDVGSPGGFLPAMSDLHRQQQQVPPYHCPGFWEFGLNNFKPTAKSKEQYHKHLYAIHLTSLRINILPHTLSVWACMCLPVFSVFWFFCFSRTICRISGRHQEKSPQ